MELLSINNLEKKDTLIYYRNEYSGTALFSLIEGKKSSIDFKADVEILPTGQRQVLVSLLGSIDYPTIPLIRCIKDHIILIETKGLS